VTINPVDAFSLAAEIGRLLATPGELTALAAAARARLFRSWSDYAGDLATWLAGLPRRA